MNVIFLELLLYLSFIPILLCNTHIYKLISSLSIKSLIAISTFIILLISAQLFKTPEHTYPFTTWNMYSSVYPRPLYLEYLVKLENDSTEHYPFELVTFTSQKAFMRRLANLKEKENTVKQLITIYKSEFDRKNIDQFTIVMVTFDIKDSEKNYTIKREEIFAYEN